MTISLPADDLADVVERSHEFWKQHRNAKVLVTGATGFIGRWLIEAMQQANDSLGCNLTIIAVTRDDVAARERLPHVFGRGDVDLIRADVRTMPVVEGVSLCIHGAASFADPRNAFEPRNVFDTIFDGTRHLLNRLGDGSKGCRLIFLSSGAVYGDQPDSMGSIPECYKGAPDSLSPKLAYGNAKRAAEWLVSSSERQEIVPVIARVFSTYGPGLSPDRHYAMASFMRDVLAGSPIGIHDGRSVRTHLYAADLAVWLLRVLERGVAGAAYNVGSSRAVTVSELAELMGRVGGVSVQREQIAAVDGPISRYVPDISRAREELGLSEFSTLEDGVAKMISWTRRALAHERV